MSKDFFKLKRNEKSALVLGGGGARGSFEIGVWKALKELDFVPNIITGTSVGALNGALMLQGKVEDAETMWKDIEGSSILDYEFPMSIDSFNEYQRTLGFFFVKAIGSKGLSSKPLKNLISEYITDEAAIRESSIDFGLSVTNDDTGEIEFFYLKDIPENRLKEYLLASASLYPAMEKTIIDGTPYMDGGYKNNIPYDMVIERKPDKMIVVDLQGPGLFSVDHRVDTVPTVWIRTQWSLGDLLLFNKKRTSLNIKLGYLETMKRANRYEGFWYTFDKESIKRDYQTFYQSLNKLMQSQDLDGLERFLEDEEYQVNMIGEISNKWGKNVSYKSLSLAVMELAGKCFGLLPEEAYEAEPFQKEIIARVQRLTNEGTFSELVPEFHLSGIEWAENIKENVPLLSDRQMTLFIYNTIKNTSNDLSNILSKMAASIKPFPFILALYILYLEDKYHL
ncbi:patatin-like phospholipase family protein [Marinilactibacillus kalidii]|uniref:patatin-like phospholipase family protein n=1 Tax=Marinilactibacillus kalidii TaxID=2820274 RepID=UPI001ABDE976|nr:patatin-like phospholipase family protein [Marinilactibacillus kalidii]